MLHWFWKYNLPFDKEQLQNLLKYLFEVYSWRGMYNQCEKYNQWGFRRHFYHVKTKFSTFFFLPPKPGTICYKKNEKKVRQNFVLVVKNFI